PALRGRPSQAPVGPGARQCGRDRGARRSHQGGWPVSGQPVRVERDGAVASLVLHDPPLNLFGNATTEALVACLDEVEASDARALVWRAEGEVFTGGADVNGFQQAVEAGGDRSGA